MHQYYRLTAIDQYRSKLSPVLYNTDVLYENNQDLYFDNAFQQSGCEDLKFIQNLPDKERIVFSMFEIDGFSHREIGNELNINENYSKWLLYNAKKILKEKLSLDGIKSFSK